eukprot:7913139-Heterocapsa_arctica.AAC.1
MSSHNYSDKISLRRNLIGTFVYTYFLSDYIGLPVCLHEPARTRLGIRSYVGFSTAITPRR